jgi:hypothetical protein
MGNLLRDFFRRLGVKMIPGRPPHVVLADAVAEQPGDALAEFAAREIFFGDDLCRSLIRIGVGVGGLYFT